MRSLVRSQGARVSLIVLVATGTAIATGSATELNVFDPRLFRQAGSQLFSASWADVFSDKNLQIGPIQVLFFAVVNAVSGVLSLSYALTLSVAVQVPLAVASALTARAMVRASAAQVPEERVAGSELTAGLGSVVLGITWIAFQTTQVGEAVVPLTWALAAALVARGRTMAAGILVGCAGAVKLWGVLGLPVLLLERDLRRAGIGATVALGTFAILWAPFVLLGDVALLDYRWPMWTSAVLHFLDPDGIYFTWPMRALQGFAVLAAATAAAIRLRSSLLALWVVPLVASATKVLLDPAFWYWYWLPIQLLVLLSLAGVFSLGRRRSLLLTVPLLGVLFVPGGSRIVLVALLLAAAGTCAFGTRQAPWRRSIA